MFKKWVDSIVEKFSQNLKSQRYFLNRQIEVVFWSVLAEPQYNPGSCQENSHDGMMALGPAWFPQKIAKATISACEKAKMWQLAIELLKDTQRSMRLGMKGKMKHSDPNRIVTDVFNHMP